MTEVVEKRSWSRGALESVSLCPACGGVKRGAKEYRRRDNEGAMPDVWTMVRCADCDSLFLDPRPDHESLPRAYADYYTHSTESVEVPEAGKAGLTWRLVYGYLNRRFGMRYDHAIALGFALFTMIEPLRLKLEYHGRHLSRSRYPQPGRLLDIGCGNGAFLLRARDMGWKVSGCEPDAAAVATCRQLGLDVLEGDAFDPTLQTGSFDVITMSHVIEHVADPLALLKRANALLCAGGTLWLALPNPDSIGLGIFGAAWRELHVPLHLCIPNQACLLQWVGHAGFQSPKLLRRGAYAKHVWVASRSIAMRDHLPIPTSPILAVVRFAADLLATFTTRWARETVLIAQKTGS